jgi:hypothetical protein
MEKLCKWCDEPVEDPAGDECHGCWELSHRLEATPMRALHMLTKLGIIREVTVFEVVPSSERKPS